MAIPKVFVSSTCYDLRQIREDLRNFIQSLGYEPRLSEYHDVAYNATESLEADCCVEVSLCDIVVGIVGGRYGSESVSSPKSISMREMEVAIENNKQIYIFIVNDVYSEFHTYKANKGKDVTYVTVDDTRIFEHIQNLQNQPNVIINSFSTANDIMQCLKIQWAGLFQNYLNNKERYHSQEAMVRISQITDALNEVNNHFQTTLYEYQNSIPTIQYAKAFVNPVHISFRKVFFDDSHPIIYFKNSREFDAFLESFGYSKSSIDDGETIYANNTHTLTVRSDVVFGEDGMTKFVDNMQLERYREREKPIFCLTSNTSLLEDDDDLPF